MSDLTPLREAVDALAGRTTPPDFVQLERRATRRARRRLVLVAAVIAVVGAGVVLASTDANRDRRTIPLEPPDPVVGAGPVWYDAEGLHHGDVVEQTPVKLLHTVGQQVQQNSALALVRTGALYLDPVRFDVWFHPWGGDPRIVGHNSDTGPGGDPSGDTAAWFELGGELVVYDTASGRVISRTTPRLANGPRSGEHVSRGNTFLQVSSERVVWLNTDETPTVLAHDLYTGVTTELTGERLPLDVHDQVHVVATSGTPGAPGIVVRAPGRRDQRHDDLESSVVRFSPSGAFLLAVELTGKRHAATVVDTRTGAPWSVPPNAYSFIAWSYGDVALVDVRGQGLLGCDAARRTCAPLPAVPPFLLPTN